MKRALPFAALAVVLVAIIASAGPRPYTALTVSGNGVTPICFAATEGAAFVMQCPNAAVWYRTVNENERTDAGALTNPATGMTDGGAFGVLGDFRTQGDPIGVLLGTGQTGICLLGVDAGSTWPCYFSVP